GTQPAPSVELGCRDVHEERDRRIGQGEWGHACGGTRPKGAEAAWGNAIRPRGATGPPGILLRLFGNPGMQRRLLFIPVSGGNGGGELQRALMLARTLRGQAGDAVDIRFVVHGQAPFPREEFQAVPLPGSPTRSEAEVAA